uniref:Uncharacterized protein n=1 Tax=Cyprinus carpio TaxID=7962 RepID=A0A8C1XZZ2_CYPCA
MYNTMLLLLFVLLVDGVSGAETDISVIEGDPVTLNTGLTEIINDDTTLWKFGPKGSLISQIARKNNFTSFFVTDDERFRGRLQVDQITGSLTIRNTRIRLSGQYQLEIPKGGTKPTYKIFNVTVQREYFLFFISLSLSLFLSFFFLSFSFFLSLSLSLSLSWCMLGGCG